MASFTMVFTAGSTSPSDGFSVMNVAPRLLVIMMIAANSGFRVCQENRESSAYDSIFDSLFLKSTTVPLLSVSLPSSSTCKNVMTNSRAAFSISSTRTRQ